MNWELNYLQVCFNKKINMKNVKNIIVVLLLVFLVSCHSIRAEADNTIKSYYYYHNILTTEIYPGIEKITSEYAKKSKIEEDELLKDIYLFLNPYVISKRIIINNIRPPVVFVNLNTKLKDGSYISYIVLRLEFIDEAKSDKYIHFGLVFINSFIIKRTHTKVKI